MLPADFRRFLPITLSQAVGLLAGLAGIHLSSRLIAPEDYGLYGLFVSLVPVGQGVVFAGLLKGLTRNWAASPARSELLREFAREAGVKLGWLALAVGAVAAVAFPDRRFFWIAPVLFVAAALLTLVQTAQTTRQAARQHWTDFGLTSVASVLRAALPPLLYAATGFGLPALLGGFTVHALLAAVLAGVVLGGDWRTAPRHGEKQLVDAYTGPMFAALAFVGLILLTMNRWLALRFFGAETGGYFGLAANVALIVPSMLGTVALQYLQPRWFGREHADAAARAELARTTDRIAALYTVAGLGASLALHGAMPWLIDHWIAARYAAAAAFVAPAGFFFTAITTGYFHHTALLAARRERACLPTDLAGAAALFVLALAAAWGGEENFRLGLVLSPLVPWVVNRTLARRALNAAA